MTNTPKSLYRGVAVVPAWALRTVASASWNRVAFGNGTFVAVPLGSNTVVTSTDGITWTSRAILPSSLWWAAVAYGNSTFAAVAMGVTNSAGSTVSAASADGVTTWTASSGGLPASVAWNSLTFGGGLFVASSAVNIATSPDGLVWTARTNPVAANWQAAAYGNGTFVLLSVNTGDFATSIDGGVTWVAHTPMPSSLGYGAGLIAYGNGTFVAIGSASPTTVAATSADGFAWTGRTLPLSLNYQSITFGNGLFVAMGVNATTGVNYAMISADGVNWASFVTAGLNQGALPLFKASAFGSNTFVSLQYGGTIAASYSPATVYTVPASTTTVVTDVRVSNQTTPAALAHLTMNLNGVPLFSGSARGAGNSQGLTPRQVLTTGTAITVMTSGPLDIQIDGVEIT